MKKFEIEQKYRILNPKKFRTLLGRMNARKIASGLERNELFDAGRMLLGKKCVLRLRRHGSGAARLTFKGPRLKGKYKKRVETELCVDYQGMKGVLKNIGFEVTASYSKMREEYALRDAHVTIDRLAGVGWFVEIEGPTAKIAAIEKKLGLKAEDREERTYLDLSQSRQGKRWGVGIDR
ncbi:MAG: class IV adenylate cyclase [Candidatus Omnitrophota bacterium]|nr:class IV adenylate cyclase [Candidatus Omnitrophota bacterium]